MSFEQTKQRYGIWKVFQTRLYYNILIGQGFNFGYSLHKKAIIWQGKVFVQDCREERERERVVGTDGADYESELQTFVTFVPKNLASLTRIRCLGKMITETTAPNNLTELQAKNNVCQAGNCGVNILIGFYCPLQ